MEKQYGRFPDWYWKYGLHDAKILSVAELELPPDWKSKNPRRNCLEICLDCKNALFETNIRKICLYNYKIRRFELNFKDLEEPWWIEDRLTRFPNTGYELEIIIETADGRQEQFIVEFEMAEIER